MTKITKAGVEKWLHRLARATKQITSIKNYNEVIGACKINETSSGLNHEVPYVHLSNGIHEIGELLDVEVVQHKEDDEYVWYRMMWEDVMFIQLDKKEGQV